MGKKKPRRDTQKHVKLDSSEMNTDIHASGNFRASLVVTYTKKAVEAC